MLRVKKLIGSHLSKRNQAQCVVFSSQQITAHRRGKYLVLRGRT